ncbi:UdgX family uracil-DNA binding protein [Haloferula chungangensis]|uniref:Type-4 uracil-DNA glycosylase n=1 Tax=Haloferula chungangensis TaxID=1048331 RepID=A0ABW2L7L6_9BACT
MYRLDPGTDFDSWRDVARRALAAGIPPHEILWNDEDALFAEAGLPALKGSELKVSAAFVKLARSVSCHCDPRRWPLLYSILWRIVRGRERSLLSIASDMEVSLATRMSKAVGREIHKMHAFVRFRKIGEREDGRERFVAWFEPEHFIVEAGTPFFRKRFANMDWSIFTPKGCAHWNGSVLSFTAGIEHDPFEQTDELEKAWLTYYRSIYNPARIKLKAMQGEMPKKFWKNLPEAELIESLIRHTSPRVSEMIETEPRPVLREPQVPYLAKLKSLSIIQESRAPSEESSIAEIAQLLPGCRQCPLWERATHAVCGSGPPKAALMIVGEQPGDQEDLSGKPFVGPAGQLLDKALAQVGIDRSQAYVTNAVKHFKWEPRGKIRLHQKPSPGEIDACKPWLVGELSSIAPRILILLGGTAARSLLNRSVSVTREHGMIDAPQLAPTTILTVHPSYLLRLKTRSEKAEAWRRFLDDLRLASDAIEEA